MENELIELENESNSVVSQAMNIIISNQDELVYADSFLTAIKNTSKKVKEYWEGPKKKASETHKEICSREKEMLIPLQNSEKIIKDKINDYREELKRIAEQEAQEQEMERQKMIEAELQKAQELEKTGDFAEAEIAKANAALIENIELDNAPNMEKVKGLSFRKNYEIIVVDAEKVPSYANGIEIRKIDTMQIKKLVKMTNNGVNIPRNYC